MHHAEPPESVRRSTHAPEHTFVRGNSTAETEHEGGGAIWARGGRLKIVNCRFFNNFCGDTGPDLGGAAVFFVSNDHSGNIVIEDSTTRSNHGGSW